MSRTRKVTNFIGKNVRLGKNVKIWHYVYVGDDTIIGDNVIIGSLAHIDSNVSIGDNTRIEGLVYVAPLSVIGRNVFIGPGAVLTNDRYPPSGKLVGVIIQDGAILGARSVVRAGVKIGRNSVIGMGAVVIRDVPPRTLVVGVPAEPLYGRQYYDSKRRAWARLY